MASRWGGEIPWSVFDLTASPDYVEVEDVDPANGYAPLFSWSKSPQGVTLYVTRAGAEFLDVGRIYPLQVSVPKAVNITATTTVTRSVGVWLDESTVSEGGDGQCA